MSAAGSLVFCLTDEDNLVVTATLEALKSVRSEQRELFLPILECLDSPDPRCAAALRRPSRRSPTRLCPFVPSCNQRQRLVCALQRSGSACVSRQPRAAYLVQGLKDHNERVRYMALCVLVRADPQGLTNTCVLAIGRRACCARRPTASGGDGRPATEAAGQQALGAKLDVWCLPGTGGTKCLRRPPMRFAASHLNFCTVHPCENRRPGSFFCFLEIRSSGQRCCWSRFSDAFTLIELLVVIAIIAILAALLLRRFREPD